MCPRTVNMEVGYGEKDRQSLDAYEKVLIDCMNGEQMLFLRQDIEEYSWAFLTPLIEDCEKCMDRKDLLKFYPSGSRGPEDVECIRMK